MKAYTADPRLLRPNSFNSNVVPPDNMEKLKLSIEELGFVTAVVCRKLENGDLEILGGQHRTQAAIELGMDSIPIVVLDDVSEEDAKKISLVDNHRYGNDDAIMLAEILGDIGDMTGLADILPASLDDLNDMMAAAEVDLENLDVELPEDEDTPEHVEKPAERPARTHDVLRFRLTMSDAEKVRRMIERTISAEGLADEDDMTAAGNALSLLLLGVNND